MATLFSIQHTNDRRLQYLTCTLFTPKRILFLSLHRSCYDKKAILSDLQSSLSHFVLYSEIHLQVDKCWAFSIAPKLCGSELPSSYCRRFCSESPSLC